jgi:hypothetical protein
MADVRLNWATAEVENAKLTVELEGEVPKGWRDTFEPTARLRSAGATPRAPCTAPVRPHSGAASMRRPWRRSSVPAPRS